MRGFRLKEFRETTQARKNGPLELAAVRQLAEEVLGPAHFFVESAFGVELIHLVQEDQSWEIFQGNLLDPAHTRERRTLEAWNLFLIEQGNKASEPVLAIRLDAYTGKLFVVRSIYCYAWEAYDVGDNVILTRETKKWVRELVGTVELERFLSLAELRDELICVVFQAVVGKSRLPLTSIEAPLPGFSLGQIGYFYRSGLISREESKESLHTYQSLIEKFLQPDQAWIEKAKLLETFLHVVAFSEIEVAVSLFLNRWQGIGHTVAEILLLLRTLFNEAALSPHTDLVDKALGILQSLVHAGYLTSSDQADFLSHLLRQQGRHLTAYDLITFHQRGANYPDALLVDAVLKALLGVVEREPHLFLDETSDSPTVANKKRLRRRGLRQGWLIRSQYEGFAVPDAPTSEGENTRILPAPFKRVPEEQILQSRRRKKHLFQDDPILAHLGENGRLVLRESIADLRIDRELHELGMALFLDRPLGFAKAPAEPDQTPLLSYVAFSASLAEQRLHYLANDLGLLSTVKKDELVNRLRSLEIKGLPMTNLKPSTRAGVVSLQDACKVAADFILSRTTRFSLSAFLDAISWDRGILSGAEISLIVRGLDDNPDALTILDDHYRPRFRVEADASNGYTSRAGVDLPLGGVRIVQS